MMKVAFVQVVDGLGETTRVVKVGWVVAWWGATEGYLRVDVKSSSRQEGDLFGDFGTAPQLETPWGAGIVRVGPAPIVCIVETGAIRLCFGTWWVSCDAACLCVSESFRR